MISLLLIAVAAILNAFMDTIENERYYRSRLRDLNEKFWYKRTSWKYCYKFGSYPVDAWHLSKSLMVICLVLAVGFAPVIPWWLMLILGGIVWNVTFNLFYESVWTK